jgi:hypothetical protein
MELQSDLDNRAFKFFNNILDVVMDNAAHAMDTGVAAFGSLGEALAAELDKTLSTTRFVAPKADANNASGASVEPDSEAAAIESGKSSLISNSSEAQDEKSSVHALSGYGDAVKDETQSPTETASGQERTADIGQEPVLGDAGVEVEVVKVGTDVKEDCDIDMKTEADDEVDVEGKVALNTRGSCEHVVEPKEEEEEEDGQQGSEKQKEDVHTVEESANLLHPGDCEPNSDFRRAVFWHWANLEYGCSADLHQVRSCIILAASF